MAMTHIGALIRERRIRRGMRVRDLAEAARVSASYIYAIESGNRGNHIEKLAAIARTLNIDPGLLMKMAERTEEYHVRVNA